jgi:hypothetical protein
MYLQPLIQKPLYSILLFKTLLKLEVLAPDPALNKYILASGFDVDGRMLE